MQPSLPLKIALVDDHKLFRKGLISLIEVAYGRCNVVFEADNGSDLKEKLSKHDLPEIVLMDINMPVLDGYQSVVWLKEQYPSIKILVVSMIEKEEAIVKMLRLGVSGYLCKDVEPLELGQALHSISNKGYYYTDFVTGRLVHSLRGEDNGLQKIGTNVINDQERKFLQWACSEMTYQEIADKMCLSPKTIDGYRNSLFEKFGVKNRVGLVIYAIRQKLVKMDWDVI